MAQQAMAQQAMVLQAQQNGMQAAMQMLPMMGQPMRPILGAQQPALAMPIGMPMLPTADGKHPGPSTS